MKIFPGDSGAVGPCLSRNSLDDAHRRQGRNYSSQTKPTRVKKPAELGFGPLLTSGHDQHVEIEQARERDYLGSRQETLDHEKFPRVTHRPPAVFQDPD